MKTKMNGKKATMTGFYFRVRLDQKKKIKSRASREQKGEGQLVRELLDLHL